MTSCPAPAAYEIDPIAGAKKPQNSIRFVESLLDARMILGVLGFVIRRNDDGSAALGPALLLDVPCRIDRGACDASAG